ncbi:MAG: hypothetical protein A3H91_00675 [Gammaproteobacteria bacterium RIFCSPLOWO2_02_FULL_61_13]|nr:MAG: hypothetical protein A3H91_00675 [Gammaproteobacteria bacterium RIFCSPLOWO2_02_FULL_61_13]
MSAARHGLFPTIHCISSGEKLLHAFFALPPSLAVGGKLLPAFFALPPSLAVVHGGQIKRESPKIRTPPWMEAVRVHGCTR